MTKPYISANQREFQVDSTYRPDCPYVDKEWMPIDTTQQRICPCTRYKGWVAVDHCMFECAYFEGFYSPVNDTYIPLRDMQYIKQKRLLVRRKKLEKWNRNRRLKKKPKPTFISWGSLDPYEQEWYQG